MLHPETVTNNLFEHIKRLDVYSRWKIAKELGSEIVYGEKGFGDKDLLTQAKRLNGDKINQNETVVGGPMYQAININLDEDNSQIDSYLIEAVPTNKPLADFQHKDFIVDISPEKVFVMFPDLTFTVSTDALTAISWEEWRTVLEEKGLFEADLEGYTESLVSLDKLRGKIKDDSMTELELRELRKKLYGFAYAIDAQIKTV